jgi:outer membrane protein insertion porin family
VDLGDNRVNVVYEINEGDRTKIAAINFVGNSAFSDRASGKDVISTKRSNLLSFVLTRDDIYDEDRLRADEEALRRFYYNRGYADFQVLSASARSTRSNERIHGRRSPSTKVSATRSAKLASTARFRIASASRCRFAVETHPGEVYSAKNEVEDTIIALTETCGRHGLCLSRRSRRAATATSRTARSRSFIRSIRAPRTYVERIEIRGNTRTRDYVIRREFDVSEGDAFNQV